MLSVKQAEISLEKGDGSSLTKIFLGAGWDVAKKGGLFGMFGGGGDSIDLDASAIMFDDNNKALDSIWFGPIARRGSIKHSGDNRTPGDGDGDDVDLTQVPSQVKSIARCFQVKLLKKKPQSPA